MAYTDVRSVPVNTTSRAWEEIMRSGQQGSVFPQALAEMFSEAHLAVIIDIDCVKKASLFPGADDEEQLIVTTITPKEPPKTEIAKSAYVAYTNYESLCEVRLPPRRGFHAVDAARDIVRLYRQYYGI